MFINQKFIGGLDIVLDLIDGEELDGMIPESCKSNPVSKAKRILEQSKLVVLINGSIENPGDDTSKSLVTAMNASKLEYTALDVSAEPGYLSAFAPGQPVPYVFYNGKPACALEGVSQLLESADLQKEVAARPLTVIERIEALLKENNAILFMKGSPQNPQCGFSRKVVDLLQKYDGFSYNYFDIFGDNELREALKKYSNWPTYPQLYVKGKLIGGIDVLQELDEENELSEALFGN